MVFATGKFREAQREYRSSEWIVQERHIHQFSSVSNRAKRTLQPATGLDEDACIRLDKVARED